MNKQHRGRQMQDIETTIAQYRQSCAKVRARIAWLGEEIIKARQQGQAVKELMDRRYLLYTELTDMQYAIGCLKDYNKTANRREQAG